MNNSDRQYKQNNNGYSRDYVDYETEMTTARNQYARNEYNDDQYNRDIVDSGKVNNAYRKNNYINQNYSEGRRANADGFERLLDEQSNEHFADDLIPSKTTMQFIGKERDYVYEDMNDRAVVEKDHALYKEGMSNKSKVMIVVYALVVLTIFTLIIMNTRLLKNMNSSISEQEARIVSLQEENAALSNRYETVSSDDEIVKKALEMGMVKGE